MTKLNELQTLFNKITILNYHFKSGIKVRIESASSFQDRIYQTEMKLQENVTNLDGVTTDDNCD